jgi:hypothetical protein
MVIDSVEQFISVYIRNAGHRKKDNNAVAICIIDDKGGLKKNGCCR